MRHSQLQESFFTLLNDYISVRQTEFFARTLSGEPLFYQRVNFTRE